MPDGIIRVIGSLIDSVYCERCGEWQNVDRRATMLDVLADIRGKPIQPQESLF